MYMLQGFVLSGYAIGIKTLITVIYNQMITRTRYIRDSYKELDISELPPGEVLQTSWNGELIFVRRLTVTEVKDTNALPDTSLLDKESVVTLSDAGNSSVLVCSAICTHLGCIPVPYLGAYKDGFAFATVQFTISSEESDKVQLKPTCHTSTILCTDQLFASRSRSSQTSHPS